MSTSRHRAGASDDSTAPWCLPARSRVRAVQTGEFSAAVREHSSALLEGEEQVDG